MKIIIDPGHGGTDPGAVGNGLIEKDINLAYASAIAGILEQYADVELTRNDDRNIELGARCDWIKSKNPDLTLSCHINAGGGTGTETIHSYKATETIKILSNLIAQNVSNTFNLPLRKVYSKQSSDGKADYYCLHRRGTINAIIIEPAFLDNLKDAAILKDNENLKKLALAVAAAVVRVYDLKRRVNTVENKDEKQQIPQWKKDGAQYLKDKGYTSKLHDPLETLDFGTLGEILRKRDILNKV